MFQIKVIKLNKIFILFYVLIIFVCFLLENFEVRFEVLMAVLLRIQVLCYGVL
jgi:hypothetical protein